jgi:hypothetical protein
MPSLIPFAEINVPEIQIGGTAASVSRLPAG